MEHDETINVDNLSVPEFVAEIRLTGEELRLRSNVLREHSAHIRRVARAIRAQAIVLPTIIGPGRVEDQ